MAFTLKQGVSGVAYHGRDLIGNPVEFRSMYTDWHVMQEKSALAKMIVYALACALNLNDTYPRVQAIVYRASGAFPRCVKVVAQDNGVRRFAFVEGVLRGRFQPRVHGAEITIVDRKGRQHTFFFFFKNHRRLPLNQTISRLCQGATWRGDAAMFRVSVSGTRLINLRSRDRALTDYAVKKCVRSIQQGKRVKIPKRMYFDMIDD
ncbi:hypothetical protein CVT26_000703 [Gymnopilus dilepis]|uniref:Uncharacterized protein n=1 Tax=Gymnopilus dilepis TaxID=231916 RepID=A0A409WB87_9AGAR|nr:hypothetical protein CVT26_000703 [Gymnopilus dilepis]